ncbi:MAG: alpha/beta fold hydrolase [Thermoplasmatota archaeon]
MRAWVMLLLLTLPAFSGCLSFLVDDDEPVRLAYPADVGYDASTVAVTDIRSTDADIVSFDNTTLSAIIVEPLAAGTLPDGSPATFPILLLGHPWATAKEFYENMFFGPHAGEPEPPVNMLEELARAGFITVAWDARGFGQSGGQVTMAGPAEMADIDALIDHVEERYPTNGLVGIMGQSYGGAQALNAAGTNHRIAAAAEFQGWTDLYHGVSPGGVPKLEWLTILAGTGAATSGAQLSPLFADWAQAYATRNGLSEVEAQMDARSSFERLPGDDTPLFFCQGLQETLFPQVDLAVEATDGFTRAVLHHGGHSTFHRPCWDAAIEWFQFFLRGLDTEVDQWPALKTVDARGGDLVVEYADWPQTTDMALYLRAPDLNPNPTPNATFTIVQRGLANPVLEPTFVWDLTGRPNNEMPEGFRQDPAAVFFQTRPFQEPGVLVGAAELKLELADNSTANLPFQVTAQLYHVTEGNSRLIARGAAAAITPDDLLGNTTLPLRLDFTKTDLFVGDALQLKLAANDPSAFAPLLANYDVTFTGDSTLMLPLLS